MCEHLICDSGGESHPNFFLPVNWNKNFLQKNTPTKNFFVGV